MITDDKFSFEVISSEDRNIILLKGIIDEDTNFDKILSVDSPLVFNFKNVASINSCGIRSWVNFLKELSGKEVIFEECPPLIVRQMNMVPSFVGEAKVTSIFLPYVCDACDKEKHVLKEIEELQGEIPETMDCDCEEKGEMELDAHPKQYLAFLK